MEHIKQHDWFSFKPETSFLDEEDIDNCAVERILRNKFLDPMISIDSDSEDEQPRQRQKINWNEVFKRKNEEEQKRHKVFVAGLRSTPRYLKLSALTIQQHFHCLKVLCAQNPHVLATMYIPSPKNYDFKTFEEVKEIYLKEQKEYLDWAKRMWTIEHSSRALRPKPITENVYEAEYKMRERNLQYFPKNFEMLAHIKFADVTHKYEMVLKQDLVTVNIANLPKVEIQEPFITKLTIYRPLPVPEPCNKHPCWFKLPTETDMTVLPLTEIHRELAQYALNNKTQIVASEGALKCLVEIDRDWTIPISVCEGFSNDGDIRNVLILGSEFSTKRKSAMERTYKAFRHLLGYALLPLSEKEKLLNNKSHSETASRIDGGDGDADKNNIFFDFDLSSDEDDNQLVINEDIDDVDDDDEPTLTIDEGKEPEPKQKNEQTGKKTNKNDKHNKADHKQIKPTDKTNSKKQSDKGRNTVSNDFYCCSCKDTMFEKPPARSFRKWQVNNYKDGTIFDMIVHCSHKLQGQEGEIITEPIVEYQIDLGGSKQSDDKIRSMALSLFLRENASVVNARVDTGSGEVVTMDRLMLEDLTRKHPNILSEVCNIVCRTFTQELYPSNMTPGHYILEHKCNQGATANLYTTRKTGTDYKFSLNFDCSVLAEKDEANSVMTPPVLTDVLLPAHKYRKILPCAFPPFPNMVAKKQKKPLARTKPPPYALRDGVGGARQFPRKSKKKGKSNA